MSIRTDAFDRLAGMFGEIGLCVQTGNTAAMYRDLFKLLYLSGRGKLEAAIYILPIKRAAERLGANYADMEHLVSELHTYSSIVTVPILVIGFN